MELEEHLNPPSNTHRLIININQHIHVIKATSKFEIYRWFFVEWEIDRQKELGKPVRYTKRLLNFNLHKTSILSPIRNHHLLQKYSIKWYYYYIYIVCIVITLVKMVYCDNSSHFSKEKWLQKLLIRFAHALNQP